VKTYRKVMSASSLSGDKVYNTKGEYLGTIEDFMLDLDSGRIAYAVLSFGGVMGMGKKLCAVPPKMLKLNEQDKCFTLDADKERLQRAPGFDRDNWPDMTKENFTTDIHAFYGTSQERPESAKRGY
jgi:sporulation protein YlmC with PRC-barrel domain